MSITFHATRADGTRIVLDFGDAAHLNMASANGRAFLDFLQLDAGDDLVGEVTLADARRAVIRCRATFERRVGKFIRQARDIRLPGRAPLTEDGIGAEYFMQRLDGFEMFLGVMAEKGATSICWG